MTSVCSLEIVYPLLSVADKQGITVIKTRLSKAKFSGDIQILLYFMAFASERNHQHPFLYTNAASPDIQI